MYKGKRIIKLSKEFIKLSQCPQEMYKELCLLSAKYPNPPDLIDVGIEESTRDHTSQSIEQTIDGRQTTFWSSKGSGMDVDEYLEYKLVARSLITSIEVKPFLAQFQRGLPCYAPRGISFSIGNAQNEIYYHSPKYPIINTNESQVFRIDPQIGKYLRINLIGKVQTQPIDDLYYTCLEKVEILGIPICKSIFYQYQELRNVFEIWANTKNLSVNDDDYNFSNEELEMEERLYEACLELLKEEEFDKVLSNMLTTKKTNAIVRSKKFIGLYESAAENNAAACEEFFNYTISKINSREQLTLAEALYVGKLSIRFNEYRVLIAGIQRPVIECTLELGMLFEESNPQVAYVIYRVGGVSNKEFEMLLKLKRYDEAAVFIYERFENTLMHIEVERVVRIAGIQVASKVAKTLLTFEHFPDHIVESIMQVFHHDNIHTLSQRLHELSTTPAEQE
ncbi:hypothetical protein HK103_005581 [Boothiomyces macroporosus]|uniref:Uncharacterized protein n=1 Tax=Boothiomyces macroporosus TaxID=261099 RepID=A0AAD5UFD8_9FUNG|nr:hypothetical protein HK103_005581 [Boothiomyces macroporosus]